MFMFDDDGEDDDNRDTAASPATATTNEKNDWSQSKFVIVAPILNWTFIASNDVLCDVGK